MGRDDSAGGSNLPAPYRSPWSLLAQDLRAALADLRLRLREWWRRNGDGSLWRPGWWPQALAPLFWPLLLALALAALAAAGIAVRDLLPRPSAPPEAPAAPSAAGDAESSRNQPGQLDSAASVSGPGESPHESPRPSASAAVAPNPPSDASPSQPLSGGGAIPGAPLRSDQATPGEPEATIPPVPSRDPFADLLEGADAQGVVVRASGQPDVGLVVLQLTPAFMELPAAERQRRAEHWQQQLDALGYEHLELRDQRAGLLGRDALVGAGMILFSQPPPA